MDEVHIYRIGKGVDLWVWSCKPCLGDLKDDGWIVNDRRKPPHPLTCDFCSTTKAAKAVRSKAA